MISVNDSSIDSYSLKGLIVQGEAGSDTITFQLDSSLTGYTWRVRGAINGGSTESASITPTETSSKVTVAWTPTAAFTAQAGMLYLTLVGTKTNGTVITKAIGSVEVLPDMAMQSTGTITQTMFEQLSQACEESAEDAEAWAVGQRGGVDVPSTDETYHNNAKYYSEQTNPSNYNTLTNRPSINSVTLEGNQTAAQLGLIADPSTKSSGQALVYDGSAWAASTISVPVTSVNGMTGSVVTSKALTASIPTTGWTASGTLYTQDIACTGVTTTASLVVSPDPAYYDAWCNARLRASAQAANTVTFTCASAPTTAGTANILVVEVLR